MEYLEREAVIAAVDKHLNAVLNKASDKTQLNCGIAAGYDMAHRHCIDVISTIPAADVREVVHGSWTRFDYVPVGHDYECSKCGYMNDMMSNYCPNCGADCGR